jgi:hypothetical protein
MHDDTERWLPVVGFEGLYEVSDLGRVKSHRRGAPRILRPGPSNYGHLSVVLGRGNTRMVHRLVLEAFAGPCPRGHESLHGDGGPTDNKLSNLRWGTRTENIRDAVRHGTWHSEKRKAGWSSPASLAALAKVRAATPPEVRLAALARGRETMRSKR